MAKSVTNAYCISLEHELEEKVSITEEEFGAILNIQQKILEMLALQKPSEEILAQLCRQAEGLLPESVATIMLLDERSGLMNVRCAPSVPAEGIQRLNDLKPGVHGGSCGNAIFNNEPTFVSDTFNDERWLHLRQLAYDFDLRSCWSMPVRDSQGQAIGTFALSSFEHRSPSFFHQRLLEMGASIVNIVLKREKQEALLNEQQSSLRLLATAVASASEGMIITDAQNNMLEINPAVEKIFGYSRSELLGQNPRLFASGKHDKGFYAQMWEKLLHERKWSGEIWNRRRNGEIFPQWMSLTPITEGSGRVTHYLALFSDLTAIKEAQNELRRQEELVIAQSRHAAMGEMMGMIAHQWRQPISAISVMAGNIMVASDLGTLDTQKLKHLADKIIQQTSHLSKTISDFSNFFKPDKLKEEALPSEIITDALDIIGLSLVNSGIRCVTEYAQTPSVTTYRRELIQVLINILKNAQDAFTQQSGEEKRITIRTFAEGPRVFIEISDNAGGIPKAIIDRLFEPYFSTKEAQHGTGLGLHICKTIVEQHMHGSISATNSNGGASFRISLPVS